MTEPLDLSTVPLHLGLNATVTALPGFEWSSEYLEDYERRFEDDGDDGRLVVVSPQIETWATWERHPAGDEVVVQLTGRSDVIQDIDGHEVVVALRPGLAMVNPKGVWHRAVVHEPGTALFITPGRGTEHRPL